MPNHLTQENYTRLLWAFEGFTSYYDDLMLLRTGRITEKDYLALLGKTISQVHKGSGRHKQSVAESSFEAWTKYYRQDENSPNAIVSYYTKGALVALLLELTQGGKQPIRLPNGEQRSFLADGDTLILRGHCEREGARRIGFGECAGTVVAARTAA